MEFTFDNNIPIYIQLLEYLKIYLISGVFKSGEKLPSVREFATTFKVNPNTMQKALSELESMKLIYTERTNGKYVTKDTKLIENTALYPKGQSFGNYFALLKDQMSKMSGLSFSVLQIVSNTRGGWNC